MGWKPGKFLKKAFKGVKKVFKKIGKGIKKAFGKIGKFFGKFGVLGQIGMMFLMGPLGNMLGGIFSGAMTGLGKWSAALIQNGGWAGKALGHAMKAIHSAGTFAGKVYTTISDGIGNAIDRTGNFFKGNGFTLSEGRSGIFDFTAQRNNPRSLLETGEYDVVGKYGTPATPPPVAPPTVETPSIDGSVDGSVDGVPKTDMNNIVEEDIQTLLDQEVNAPKGVKVGEVELPTVGAEEMLDADFKGFEVDNLLDQDKSFYQSVKDDGFFKTVRNTVSEGIDDFKNLTPDEIASKVTGRIEKMPLDAMSMAGTQEMARGLGWEVGDQHVSSYSLMDIPETKTRGAVFNEIDYMSQVSGNNYYGDMVKDSYSILPEELIASNAGYADAWHTRNANLMYESDNMHRAVYGYGV